MAGSGDRARFLWAIAQQESGGDYTKVNRSSGALGKYQVMPRNVADWTKVALGHSLTPQQFLANPAAQEAVANKILGGYYDKYGAAGAAAMWYSGQPDPNKKTKDKPTIPEYVHQVLGRMNSSPPVNGSTPSAGGTVGGGTSRSSEEWWDFGLGDSLSKGLQDGLMLAFKSIIGPLMQWLWWGFETLVGIGLVVGGVFLLLQQSGDIKDVEKFVFRNRGE